MLNLVNAQGTDHLYGSAPASYTGTTDRVQSPRIARLPNISAVSGMELSQTMCIPVQRQCRLLCGPLIRSYTGFSAVDKEARNGHTAHLDGCCDIDGDEEEDIAFNELASNLSVGSHYVISHQD